MKIDAEVIPGSKDEVPKKGTSILIIPETAIVPDDVELAVFDWSWESIVQIIAEGNLPVILRADANSEIMLNKIAAFHELTLKTLQGLPGDYPSFWQITFSAYPKVSYQEMQLAKENSQARGGNGVQPNKLPKSEFKALDPKQHVKLSELSNANWESSSDELE